MRDTVKRERETGLDKKKDQQTYMKLHEEHSPKGRLTIDRERER